jgi:F0F1-type ATP synthase assembly protein I
MAFKIISKIFLPPYYIVISEIRTLGNLTIFLSNIIFILLFICFEFLQRDKQHALQIDNFKLPEVIKWSLYYVLIIVIFTFGGTQQEFIYFQF